MPKLSIIVPIYNAAQYLHRCIDSILSQSFTDYELLLIDDGSADESSAICDEYAVKDARIRVFHKENGGVSSARNLGLDNAQGEWIYFVDADDEVLENTFEVLCAGIKFDADIVMGGLEKANNKGDILYRLSSPNGYLEKNDGILINYGLSKKCPGNWGWMTIRLFNNKIIQTYHIRFEKNITYNEDELFIVDYLCKCQGRTFCIPYVIYRYYESETSVMESTKKRFNPALLTSFDSFVRMKRLICNDPNINQSVKNVSKDGIINRYLMIANNMQKHNIKDKQTLSNFKKICIKECGLAYFITFYLKRFCRKSIRFVCKKLHLKYEIS